MARKIHIHLYTGDAEPDDEGKWVTINGAHVFVGKGGKIEKGPKELVGLKPSTIEHQAKLREMGSPRATGLTAKVATATSGPDPKRKEMSREDRSTISKLATTTGEGEGSLTEAIKRNGFFSLEDKHDTPKVRAILKELEALGWDVDVSDRGASVAAPWAK